MENTTSSPSPKVRWYRRRGLLFALLLLIGCVGAFLTWDTLFMPADLRRMQGTWKVVRTLQNGMVERNEFHFIVISGRRLSVNDELGNSERSASFDIIPERQDLLLFHGHEIEIFGHSFELPSWIRRGQNVETFHYTFEDAKLRIRDHNGDELFEIELVR